MFDKQKDFDAVLTGLRAQNALAKGTIGECFYRAPDGNKCAIGQLISDEKYDPKLEGKSAYNATVFSALYPEADFEEPAVERHRHFLSELQRNLHDDLEHFNELEGAAEGFARSWKLEYTRI